MARARAWGKHFTVAVGIVWGYGGPVTDNLPAPAPRFGTGHSPGTPLTEAPTAALAFALGYACARPVDANAFGPFCAMVEELMARPSAATNLGPIGGWDLRNQFGALIALLPPDLSRSIVMLYQAQRGQRWARTGQYRHGRDTGRAEAVDEDPGRRV